MSTDNPSAQGAVPAEPASAVPAEAPGQESPLTGIQKRIDELTAKYHNAERTAEELRAQNAQLLQAVLTTQRAAPAPEPEPAAPDLEPGEAEKLQWAIDRAVAKATAPLQQMQSYIGQLESQLYTSQVQAAAQQLGVEDPEVTRLAAALSAEWSRKGYFKQGVVTVDNAVDIALGQKARQEAQKRVATGQRAAFNQLGQPIGQVGSPPAPARKPEPELTYEDIESDPRAAIAALTKKLGIDQ